MGKAEDEEEELDRETVGRSFCADALLVADLVLMLLLLPLMLILVLVPLLC